MRFSYRGSLYASFLITVTVPILLSFIFFQTFLRETARNEFYPQAERVAFGVTEEIKRRSESLLLLAKAYSKDRLITSAAASRDRALLEERLPELYKYSNLDLLEVGDSNGYVLARGHRPGEYGEQKLSQHIIKNALDGRLDADIEYGASGIALRAVAPILSPQGKPLGTLMTGVLLNRDFFDIYKTITGFDFALFEGDKLLASTCLNTTRLSPHLPPGKPKGSPLPARAAFMLGRSEMWGVSIPVYHISGSLFGSLLLWKDRDTILKPLRVNQLTLALSFLMTCILATVLAVFLSRNFSSPLKKMLPVMDRVSRGEMDMSIPHSRWKEFQELSQHFQNMVSELRKSQDKIMRTQQRLIVTAKFAILGQVTAELAHEVRNPLNSMEIALRLLKEELGEGRHHTPAIMVRIDCLHSEIKRLDQTIRDFIEAGGNITLRKTRSNLAEETHAVLTLARPQIEMLGIRLSVNLSDALWVTIDRNRFHQAVLNILLNACQAMKPGGTISIESTCAGDKATLVIRDTGVGMTGEEKDRIFDFPFTTKPEGTGCGLPYVLQIVQAHGGEFDLDSEPGVGTTVRISFPVDRKGARHEKSSDR